MKRLQSQITILLQSAVSVRAARAGRRPRCGRQGGIRGAPLGRRWTRARGWGLRPGASQRGRWCRQAGGAVRTRSDFRNDARFCNHSPSPESRADSDRPPAPRNAVCGSVLPWKNGAANAENDEATIDVDAPKSARTSRAAPLRRCRRRSRSTSRHALCAQAVWPGSERPPLCRTSPRRDPARRR